MTVPLTLDVNGERHALRVEPGWTLLRVLRDELELTGAKEGCDDGECGSCTVLLDGAPVNACILLALQADGRAVRTVEGVAAAAGGVHPLQRALVEHGAVQCGFCTPGIVMAALGAFERPGVAASDPRGVSATGPRAASDPRGGATGPAAASDPHGANASGSPAAPDEPAVRRALAGNLCRCTGYQKVVHAVMAWTRENDERERHGPAA